MMENLSQPAWDVGRTAPCHEDFGVHGRPQMKVLDDSPVLCGVCLATTLLSKAGSGYIIVDKTI